MFPMIAEGKPVIFAGRFGSGKTEVSLNYATRLSAEEKEKKPILVDLDIVTPYFRTRELVAAMETRGVEVVAPLELTQSVDVPAVTPEILGAIEQTSRPVVLDVGGDRQGARALGRYSDTLQRRGYVMCFVVNPYRPHTATPEAVRASVQEIEASSRLRVSSLVSNPNLMNETGPGLIWEGHAVVEASARLLDLPVSFVVVSEHLLHTLSKTSPPLDFLILPLERYFVLPWEASTRLQE